MVKIITNFSGQTQEKELSILELAENADHGITMSKLGRSMTDSDLHYYWLLCHECAKSTPDFKVSYYNVATLSKCQRSFQSKDDKKASKSSTQLEEIKYTFTGRNLTEVAMTFKASQPFTIKIGKLCYPLANFIKQIL